MYIYFKNILTSFTISFIKLKVPVRRSSDHGPKIMPPPAVAGHQPRKITMNKFGGGTTNFGSNFGAMAQQPGWKPQPSIYSEQYTPQPSMQVDGHQVSFFSGIYSYTCNSFYKITLIGNGSSALRTLNHYFL